MSINYITNRIFILTLFISVFQIFFLNIGGVVLSLYFLMTYSIIFGLNFIKIRKLDINSLSYIFLIFFSFIAIAWSDQSFLSIRSILFILSGYIIFCYTRKIVIYDENIIYKAFKLLCYAIALHSIIITIFFFFPDIELGFLSSSLAKIFINNGSLESYQLDFGNNVTDPDKAGGFFLNGNAAAILSEVGFYLPFIVNYFSKFRFLKLIVVINFMGIVFTGSKSALFLAVFSFILSFFIFSIFLDKSSLLRKQFYILILVLSSIFVYFLSSYFSNSFLYSDSVVNAERREVIFNFAYRKFLDNPFLGLGFGGWEKAFYNYGEGLKVYGLSGGMPAHNYFIISWSNGGILLLISAFLYYLVFIFAAKRLYLIAGKKIAVLFFAIFICVFAHSMVDNVLIYEDPHYSGIFAALLAWASYMKRSYR